MGISNSQRDILKDLGKLLKEIRISKGLTLKDVSHKIDKDPQSIHRLEQGGVNPSYLYLLEICKGLDITMDELIQLKNKPTQ